MEKILIYMIKKLISNFKSINPSPGIEDLFLIISEKIEIL